MVVYVGDPLHLLLLMDGLKDLCFEDELRMLRERWLLKPDNHELGGLDVRAKENGAEGA